MLARIAATAPRRAVPRNVRLYTENTFSKKEKAEENQFARSQETAALKRLRAEIEKKKAELAQLEKEHAEEVKKA